MREQQQSGMVRPMEKWPFGGMVTSEDAALPTVAAEPSPTSSPLVPLSLDTVLTAGDVKRILKIISSL